jgi:hypothetical protein
MDGGRAVTPLNAPAHHKPTNAPTGSSVHRCGWCGLLPLPEGRALGEHDQLCAVCFGILKGVDWRGLLNGGAAQVA